MAERDLLRFLTAGSVDDGKSTLIGRLLHDSNGLYQDQLASVRSRHPRPGSIFRCSRTACAPSANRVSRSTSRTGISDAES